MHLRDSGTEHAEQYPHQDFLNDDSAVEFEKRSRFISHRFVLPRIKRNWNERDDAASPTDAELHAMETMTLDRVVDRALAKAVWVRAAITNMHELRDSDLRGEEPDLKGARRAQRKLDYWTAEREAVDHAVSAVINTRAQVLATTKPRRRKS